MTPLCEVRAAQTPQSRWRELRAEFLKSIEEINAATPWQEVEPKWWLEMMDVSRSLREQA